MKVILKCKDLKYEDIKEIKYLDRMVIIIDKRGMKYQYEIKEKEGTYIVIYDDHVEYINKSNQ